MNTLDKLFKSKKQLEEEIALEQKRQAEERKRIEQEKSRVLAEEKQRAWDYFIYTQVKTEWYDKIVAVVGNGIDPKTLFLLSTILYAVNYSTRNAQPLDPRTFLQNLGSVIRVVENPNNELFSIKDRQVKNDKSE